MTSNIFTPIIEMRIPADLKPDPRNAKTHPVAQLKKVTRSIQEFGWTNPILIDENDNVLAGHLRLLAAKELGLTQVPAIRLSHMSSSQKRAYVIADNKLAELGKWDQQLLALELEALQLSDPAFSIALTGFDDHEAELIIDNVRPTSEASIPPLREGSNVSQVGDMWELGDSRLLCGNALDPECFERLLGAELAQMVFADAPYNVPINGHVRGKGKFGEFVMASGEMTSAEFTDFLTRAFANLRRFSIDGSIHYLFMDWRHMREMIDAVAQYSAFKNLVFWNKGSGSLGTMYRSQHELVYVMKNGDAKHINNFGLGETGRYRTNVWDYPGLSSWGANRDEELGMHPTVKPVALVADAIKDCSKRSGIILDCFGGSGTTLIAAEQTGRRARLIELDPAYVDVTIRRYQAATGREAVLSGDGCTFSQVEKDRRECSQSTQTTSKKGAKS